MTIQTTAPNVNSSCSTPAQSTASASSTPCNCSTQSGFLSCVPIALMILVFYFLIMRPQQKREAKRRELMSSIKKGDRVLTSSGIIGALHKIINEKEVSIEVSDGVYVRILKNSIAEVLEKNSVPVKEETERSDTCCKPTGKKQSQKVGQVKSKK